MDRGRSHGDHRPVQEQDLNRSNQTGQATVFVLGMGLIALAVTAFTVDGTRAFLMRRTLQNAADAAAISGASQLDRNAYYSSGGSKTLIEPSEAEASAMRSIDNRGIEVEATVEATPFEVAVLLRTEVPSPFLRLIGIGSVPVSAQATAEPSAGGMASP